ncbi:histidine phosphatase family protein [Thiohalorhabdus sp.]|uniref:histidine phosphatase family protein n=1 Tax=Thiohalorhabdus sp. TaxID=3094134 RepID=UPI002FC34B41
MDASETLIDLIRHGQPEGGRMFRGVTDHSLSEQGWAEMRLATAGEAGWEVVVTSPLTRCAEFAEVLADARGLPLERLHGLREMDFGAWDGRTASDILANGPGDLSAFWADPERAQAPEGEALADFRERVVSAWEHLLARYAGRHVLVVGHGGAIRVTLAHVLGMPLANLFRMEVPYAGRSRVRSDDAGVRLVAHGSHE